MSEEDKTRLAVSMMQGTMTVVLDELIDDGGTMGFALRQIRGLVDSPEIQENVYGVVLHRKPKFFQRYTENSDLMKSVKYYVRSYEPPQFLPNMWLVYPWEQGKTFDTVLSDLVYNRPIDELRSKLRSYAVRNEA